MLENLESFNTRLEKATEGLLYQWKDPKIQGKIHYTYNDHILPLSVTPEEGDLLFQIMRELKPERIIEAGTGTGVSAAYMLGGWPTAKLLTCDNFTEGSVGTSKGENTCHTLWKRLGIDDNIKLFSIHMRNVPMPELVGDVLFMDGTIKGQIQGPLVNNINVLIEHDAKGSIHRKSVLRFPTHCYLSVHSNEKQLMHRLSGIGGTLHSSQ